MANIVPFESAGVPAFLTDASDNADMLAHASQAFPVISIKGKVFTIVKGDERTVIPNSKDPDSPATNIIVALVKVSPFKSKTYYRNGFQENAEDRKPTCFSNDGKTPDASVAEPQCKTCAACKWNIFGTSRGENGVGKGKACGDFVKIVVASTDAIDTPFLMRVPPASIKALGEYGSLLAKRKVPYQGIATKISFDMKEATPRLKFEPFGYLDEATYRKVQEVAASDIVTRMINGNSSELAAEATVATPVSRTKAEEVKAAAAEEILNKVVPEKPAEAPKPEEKPAVVDGSLESALSNLGF